LAAWETGTVFDLGPYGSLELKAATGIGLSRGRLPRELQVTSRTAGELFRPAGAGHRRPLRKWLQERGVLPWLRQRVPLVIAQGEIVAIGDLAYGHGLDARPGEPSWVVAWHGRPALTELEALETPTNP
jgi:tRNA(Ile)-lysidine synthase